MAEAAGFRRANTVPVHTAPLPPRPPDPLHAHLPPWTLQPRTLQGWARRRLSSELLKWKLKNQRLKFSVTRELLTPLPSLSVIPALLARTRPAPPARPANARRRRKRDKIHRRTATELTGKNQKNPPLPCRPAALAGIRAGHTCRSGSFLIQNQSPAKDMPDRRRHVAVPNARRRRGRIPADGCSCGRVRHLWFCRFPTRSRRPFAAP